MRSLLFVIGRRAIMVTAAAVQHPGFRGCGRPPCRPRAAAVAHPSDTGAPPSRSATANPTGPAMIDLYYWTTPNGHKISIFLEEAGLPYAVRPIHIGKGEQFAPEFLAIAPNNRIPAIVDHAPADGGASIPLFESGAILLYLADKTRRFLPQDLRGRNDALQWLFWQMGGLGPMAGQNHHFGSAAPEKIPYAIDRYVRETARLYGVLDRRLADREFVAGDYSIADMASYPWIVSHAKQQQDLGDFPHLRRWFETIRARPAVQRAYALVDTVNPAGAPQPSAEEQARILYGVGGSTKA